MLYPSAASASCLKSFSDLRRQALNEFDRQQRICARHQLWDTLRGQRRSLLELKEVQQQIDVVARTHTGTRMVSIDQIRGSEGRSHDFDVDFRPRRRQSCARWTSIAMAYEQDLLLPPVNLIQVGDIYFVRDGHHRISVARAHGQLEIEAEVTVWQCRESKAGVTVIAATTQENVGIVTLGKRVIVQSLEYLQRVANKVHSHTRDRVVTP